MNCCSASASTSPPAAVPGKRQVGVGLLEAWPGPLSACPQAVSGRRPGRRSVPRSSDHEPRKIGLNDLLEIVSTGLITRLAAVMAMVERLVPDGLWELFQRVVPAAPVRPQGGGRRMYGDRQVLAAIIFVATTGCTWRQLPPGFGPSGPTAHRRFTEWSRARVWGKLHRLILDELGGRGTLNWSRCAIDSVNMRAAKGGI